MKKKRRKRPSSSTVKVGRVKKQKQTVKVIPVLFPGAADQTGWDEDTTHQLIYESVGIASDPNKIGKTGRNSARLDEPKADKGDGAEGDDAGADGKKKILDAAVHRNDGRGERRPSGEFGVRGDRCDDRRGGAKEAHHQAAEDRGSAGRQARPRHCRHEPRHQAQQDAHTVAQLRELVVSFLAYPELLQEGPGSSATCRRRGEPPGRSCGACPRRLQ